MNAVVKFFFMALLLCAHQTVTAQSEFVAPENRSEHFLAEVDDILDASTDTAEEISRTKQKLRMKILSGTNRDGMFVFENASYGSRTDLLLQKGDKVVMQRLVDMNGEEHVILKEKYRITGLLWAAGSFLLLAFCVGGLTGITSLFGLLVSIAVLAFVIVPSIVEGNDPLLTCLIGSYVIAVSAIYLAHGFSKRTSVAVLSTLITLSAAAILAFIAVRLTKLFGLGSEEALFLLSGTPHPIDLRGLLLGGMIIGALGVLDDITTAQTAAIHEIKKANPSLGNAKVFAAARSIGREHIASLINTLALAYAGTSLPLLALFAIDAEMPLWVTLNSEFIAEEIVRTLVGSAALLLAVPISTTLAVNLLRGTEDEGCGGHAHHH